MKYDEIMKRNRSVIKDNKERDEKLRAENLKLRKQVQSQSIRGDSEEKYQINNRVSEVEIKS